MVEDLFCGASSGFEPSLFFQHYFTCVTDEAADCSVVPAEL